MTNFWNLTQPRILATLEVLGEALMVPFSSIRDAVMPPSSDVLERRTRKLLSQHDRRIKRLNATAENHERTIMALNQSITEIDHEITEIEVYADVLERLLDPS